MFTLDKVFTKRGTFGTLGFKDSEGNSLEQNETQKYNPLYSLFFDPTKDSNGLANMELNHKYFVQDPHTLVDKHGNKKAGDIFIKHSPLLDPVHYLVGKYEKQRSQISVLPNVENKSECHQKLFDSNNASYVDNFFNYLSSQMLHSHHLLNGIDYYGSNLMIQKRFRYNVYDDIEYLQDSEFFMNNNHKTYVMEDLQRGVFCHTQKNTQSRRPRLCIETTNEEVLLNDIEVVNDMDDILDITPMDEDMVCEYSVTTPSGSSVKLHGGDEIDEDNNSEVSESTDGMSDNSECSNTDDEGEDGDECEDDEGDGDDDGEEEDEDEELYAYLFDFPVQMIALERCDGTLDSLLEEKRIKDEEIISGLMQVIFTLILYQKTFSFTHNDLHTNNIVYKNTDRKFISYTFQKKHYKVPTYGRIFKIIDFGRSIYRYQDKILCSDSFAPGGDAHGQYNTEPYFNPNKPRLEPNPSFDLCRLGCSMYDFLFEDEEDEFDPDPDHMTALQKTIHRWCQDENGKNILYKRNGDERYPNFKLYKMIARHVKKHTPESQLSYAIFSQFISKTKTPMNHVNIDSIPKYWINNI